MFEPLAHVEIESDAMHVVVKRLLERRTKHIVVDAGEVREIDIVVSEGRACRRGQDDAVLFWMFADR